MSYKLKQTACYLAISICIPGILFGQSKLKYLDPKLSTEVRVKDLVSRLTLSQKIKLLRYTSTAIDSAGVKVPAYNWWNECLHGVARAGKATVFPQTIGLAATWDQDLAFRVSSAISDEARAKYDKFSKQDKRGIYQGLNFWTPNINIFRDPRWGRGMETYGEDPYLTGKMASSFIRGIQGNDPKYYKAIATVKHFVVHSGPESTRHTFDAEVSDNDFYQTYTPAFKMCIQDAKVYSVMCAYNRFRGQPCCGNSFLLSDLLRKQWGFKGFIVTDCGAVADFYTKGAHEVVPTPEEAAAMAIKSGVDLECGGSFDALPIALHKNLITPAELDVAVERLFTARFKLGFFDDPKATAYLQIPYSVVESEAHKQLALEAAKKSIVLLKNEGNTLPLSKTIKTLAVIGPNANDADVMLANYHGFPTHVVTPLEGLKNKLKDTRIVYAKGSRHAEEVPSLDVIGEQYFYTDVNATQHGINAVYYNNSSFSGKPAMSRTDKNIDFYWINNAPEKDFDQSDFSAKWSGYIKAPVSGKYSMGIYGYDQYELYLDDSLVTSFKSEHEPALTYKSVNLKAGVAYKFEVKYASTKSAPLVKLKWEIPNQNLQAEALNICKNADAVVMCMGLSPQIEGEEMNLNVDGFYKGDRTKLKLPDTQLQLMKAVKALGKPVILVLINGSAVAVNWENDNIPAIVEAWYGGQEGGNAIADVLTGNYNPSGRLPVTFYKSEDQLPKFDDYNMKGRTYRYFTGKPLYEFGYGLSYTTFAYSNFVIKSVTAINTPVTVTSQVKNTGKYNGGEVVQLYIKNNALADKDEVWCLKSFKKLDLNAGESKTVQFILKPEDFSVIDQNGNRIIKPGNFTVYIGGKQPTSGTAKNETLNKKIKLMGKVTILKT
jgi:beta-glucosidase